MRVKSEIWVSAYLRRCNSDQVCAMLARRGDPDAGAIYIHLDALDGRHWVIGPAPSWMLPALGGQDRLWRYCLGSEPVSAVEAASFLQRETEVDPDLWIIALDNAGGQHFLAADQLLAEDDYE